ncbi:hypothetical protein C3432_26930 [Citrobacter amalonaticus]|uniref:Uncharacterized protein n=1 Tax=Citrobacter amalonaticus TaxID=35703 RepID=A0A2S4RQ90_CITAM|nr:hypothetical protein [Citrobacter amalonaticus]POT54476.1 hypothetical protein C3432_26930 [Citrobacter amalonaticus]POT69338.1 hypothetical protein C3436_26535 [Citrobacter amalonaticus]POU59933.1 hypothetical protein C3430_26185 [Citrobacter amalonaticus]POV02391.1 hypothetical protein C3424_26385 [Citrobacter amalonaticus]
MFTSSKENSNEDFGRDFGLAQVIQLSKISQIAHEWNERGEKSTNRKKDRKKACAIKWDPYNAPPSTRRM